jgi:hypothetical protein
MRRCPVQLAALSFRHEVLQAHWPLAQTGLVSDKGKAKVHPLTFRDVTDGGSGLAVLQNIHSIEPRTKIKR